MAHLPAYWVMSCPAGVAIPVVARAGSLLGSVTAITRTGRDRNTPGHG
jgi:hypothetical protein